MHTPPATSVDLATKLTPELSADRLKIHDDLSPQPVMSQLSTLWLRLGRSRVVSAVRVLKALSLWACSLSIALGLTWVALGQQSVQAEPQIVFVPYSPKDLTLAMPVHEDAHITLKGILRGADCHTYTVYWDVNGDQQFDHKDNPREVSPSEGTVYDIGRTFKVPRVEANGEIPIDFRVYNHCTGVNTDSTYFLYVYNWSPSPNPDQWTKPQREVMVQMGIQEALWYIHRHINRGGAQNQMTGYMNVNGSWYLEGSMTAAWALNVNGRLPAYPPGTLNTFGHDVPQEWFEKNDERWANDPYAETAARLMNYIVGQGFNSYTIGAVEEANTCGIAQGVELTCEPIPTTDDRVGFALKSSRNCAYRNGLFTGGIATVLSGLAHTPIQVGSHAGLLYEVAVQQLVDYLGNMQIDGGGGYGGWDYWNTEGNKGGERAYGSLSQWAYIGLESAEVAGKPFGVIVNNRHKFRIPDHLLANQGPRGGASYRTSDVGAGGWVDGNYHLSGGAIVANRWLEIDKMDPNSDHRPFSVINGTTYSNLTEQQMVSSYNRYMNFIADRWTSRSRGWHGSGRLWTNGDYTCGNRESVYRWGNHAECGNLYGIYSHQKGYRTGKDTLEMVGGRDWAKQFEVTMLRQQHRSLGDYGTFGLITDCGGEDSILCHYGGPNLTVGIGALILTPTIFNPKPIAKGAPEQVTVVEGCASATNGFVTLSHEASFHPNPNARIELYQWDVGTQDHVGSGRWWTEGTPPDFERGYRYQDAAGNELEGRFAQFQYQYMNRGSYTAQLRVVESLEDANNPGARILAQDRTFDVEVTVEAAPNSPPSASTGGPYIIERGDDLRLAGLVSDRNTPCGDTLTVGWEFHPDQTDFDDFDTSDALVPAAYLNQFAEGIPHTIRLRVTDDGGGGGADRRSAQEATTLTIYQREPIAVAHLSANPIRCQQTVNFDGSQSYHPNPERTIERYEWDVDGRPGIDGGGAQPNFSYTYTQFGTYPISLTVIDDHQERHTLDTLSVEVNQGNTKPVARIAQREYTLLEGNELVLSAAASYDSDTQCGDRIITYEWDLNGDGQYRAEDGDIVAEDPRAQSSVLTLPWAEIAQKLAWPTDRHTFEPANRINLRVSDTFGDRATSSTVVYVFRSEPEAYFDQLPDPAPIDEELGRVEVVLDARESYSPIPEGSIVRYEWDLNNDGVFDDSALPVVSFLRIFNDLDPSNIPRPIVRLRVTDHIGQQSTFERALSFGLGDVPPTADADPSDAPELGYHILVGDPLVLSAAQTLEPNAGDFIQSYRWKLGYEIDRADPRGLNWGGGWDLERIDDDRDGEEAVIELSPETLAQMGYQELGEYGLLLEVEDSTFLTARDTSSFTIHSRDPVAAAVIDPPAAACGQRVTLDASDSGHPHPGINITEWAWDMNGDGDFDDAEDARGERTTYVADRYTFDGPVTVTLRVTDDRGHQSFAQATLAVDQANSVPAPNAGGPYVIARGDGNAPAPNDPDAIITLDASASIDINTTCGDAIVRYAWDLGEDGVIDSEDQRYVLTRFDLFQRLGVTHSTSLGRHWATLTVWDRFGASSIARVPIDIVKGPTAVARVVPNTFGCSDAVTFDGSASFTDGPVDLGYEMVEYAWDFNLDGVIDAMGEVVSRNYVGEAGLSFAGLIVIDASGRVSFGITNYELVIDDLPPIADAGGPYVTGKDQQNRWIGIDLDARASRDPNAPCDQITHYLWDTDRDGLYGRYDTDGAPGIAGRDYEGELIRGYINPNWRVGSVQLINLIACDDPGATHCSGQPAQVRVEVTENAPPAGEIISPRAGSCLNDEQVRLRLRVRDVDGEQIAIKVFVDGALVTESAVQTTQGQDWEIVELTLNTDQFAEGARMITVSFTDGEGASATANAGGLITFDRTEPEVGISPHLIADACYRASEVPDYQLTAHDNVDPAPVVDERTDVNVCERYLIVTATDACGNSSEIQRRYRVAESVLPEIDGPADGSLASPEQSGFSWSFDLAVDELCVNQITATLSRDGLAPWVYQPGELTEEVGNYTFTLNVPTCVGDPQIQRRNFRVNGPPVAMPVSLGHPNADHLAPSPTYVIEEGLALRLEGDDSLPPEPQDEITRFSWDLDGDGLFEAEGAQVNFNTDEDGLTVGLLEVEDRFGLTHERAFEVFVTDVDPIVDGGGPYNGVQGQPLTFDARLSREATPADQLTEIEWTWGDQTPSVIGAPAEVALTEHTFADDGRFEVLLTVRDEDSQSSQRIQVNIRDVFPEIVEIQKSEGAYALRDITFEVIAMPGAPSDPITSYDFDFLGDGIYREFPSSKVTYQYQEAGTYEVRLRVRDIDSAVETSFPFTVRPVTLSDLLRELDAVVNAAIDAAREGGDQEAGVPQLSNRALVALAPQGQPSVSTWVARGLWAESQRASLRGQSPDDEAARVQQSRQASLYRGNTLMVFDELLFRLNRAQERGARWDSLMWKISRQLIRETQSFADELLAHNPDYVDVETFQRGLSRLADARALFEDIDFKDRVVDRDGFLARDLFALIYDAHFALRHTQDLSTIYQGFPAPLGGDAVNRLTRANEPNGHVNEALSQLELELRLYLSAAGTDLEGDGEAHPDAPGIDAVRQALEALVPIQASMSAQVGICLDLAEGEECPFLGEFESLELQLRMMDLVAQLFSALDQGVYVRNAQKMLTLAVRFRVEIDLIRIELECGRFSPYPLAARAQQAVMLQLLELGQDDAALLFYISPERRCLAIQQYNECVVPAVNRAAAADEERLDVYPYPELCEGIGEQIEDEEPVIAVPPIAGRTPLDDLGLLYDILMASAMEWNIADPQVLAQRFPHRTWSEMNRDHRDQAFTLSDYQFAVLQFNHDLIDYDEDGLYGSIEIDCVVINGVQLSVTDPQTQGVPDGDLDCDGDGIPNLDEVEMTLNPNQPDDATLDLDQDGMTNYQEWFWDQRGLETDIRDPSDARRDHDNDGVINTLEVQNGMDPLNPGDAQGDFDQDGLSNAQEVNVGLDPRDGGDADLDPDEDGLTSREEIARGRDPLVADCVDDPDELDGRNDHPLSADEITPDLLADPSLTLDDPLYVKLDQGVVCNAVGTPDHDWYRFRVPQPGMRVVARLTSDDPDLEIKLFDGQQGAIEQSVTQYPDELIATPRGQLSTGDYLLRVSRSGAQAAISSYELELSLLPRTFACLSDPYEGLENNDRFNRAFPLPTEGVRDGALWICGDERVRGDWLAIPVSDHDLTVHIRFSPTSDGLLLLSALTQDFDYVESVEVNKTSQCLNIRRPAGAGVELIYLNVTASTLFTDGDDQVDYALQVVHTDLQQSERGACDVLNQGLYLDHSWPLLDLGD